MEGDERSPGEIINDTALIQKLMFRIWNRVFEDKGAVLTRESTRYVLAALQSYYMQRLQFSEFAAGMHFQIEVWPPTQLPKIVAKVENVTVAHATFEGAQRAYPTSMITMRHGALLMRTSTSNEVKPLRDSTA